MAIYRVINKIAVLIQNYTTDNSLFKVNSGNTRAMDEICSKLIISHQSDVNETYDNLQ